MANENLIENMAMDIWRTDIVDLDESRSLARRLVDRGYCKQSESLGCEICNKPAKWFAVFGVGFPFLRVNKVFFEEGQINSKTCPFCGRDLEEIEA